MTAIKVLGPGGFSSSPQAQQGKVSILAIETQSPLQVISHLRVFSFRLHVESRVQTLLFGLSVIHGPASVIRRDGVAKISSLENVWGSSPSSELATEPLRVRRWSCLVEDEGPAAARLALASLQRSQG